MDKTEIILLTGIIISLIWLGVYTVIQDRNRKKVIIAGIIIDVILFIICRSCSFLLVGILGGILGGLGFGWPIYKYQRAVNEMNGIKNLVIAFIIFFVMIFMTISIVFPEAKIDFG